MHLVDQEQCAALGAGGGLADLPQQVDQVLFGIPESATPATALTSNLSCTPPGATTLNALTTPRARSTRSRMRCFRLISLSKCDAIWAKVEQKSG